MVRFTAVLWFTGLALAQANLESVYRRWLNEDVAYIVTDAERAVFRGLTTDDDREQFIEQFWARRDPTPGTVENEFREEHYRRISYANEHFEERVAGWKTDRGRIYITYGPPDEIEDYSAGGTAQGYPFYLWHYRFIEGMGQNVVIEFADAERSREFRMAAVPATKTSPSLSPAAMGNVYVSNEPGGRALVNVLGHVATITLPFPSDGRYEVMTRITNKGASPVNISRASLNGSSWGRSLSLAPGSYSLTVMYRKPDTAESWNETVNFFVY